MKERVKGGFNLINLSSMVIEETESAVNISDEEVLKQLFDLNEYAFNENKTLKSVYVVGIDENDVEFASTGEISRNNGALRIIVHINEHILSIVVTYDVDSETGERFIDVAQYEYIEQSKQTLESLATSDLIVKTLTQTDENWEQEFHAPSVEGFTLLNEFCKCIIVNKSFKIILCARYRNDDAENTKAFKLGTSNVITLPQSVGDKIYDLGGKKVSETIPSGSLANLIRMSYISAEVYGVNSYIQSVELTHYSLNQIRLAHNSNINVTANNVIACSIEINLTI